ncbi:hypothetical protein KHA80_12825 [Anaerobacillus sp. HL2]|nr:hypothetical protein KHA80_12825 [Anaerobacillus sp. HL2]
MAVLTISVARIPITISKLISEARAKKDDKEVRDIFLTSIIVCFFVKGFDLVFLYVYFSEKVALVLGGTYATYSIMIVSVTLMIAPYMAVYRGFFQGV